MIFLNLFPLDPVNHKQPLERNNQFLLVNYPSDIILQQLSRDIFLYNMCIHEFKCKVPIIKLFIYEVVKKIFESKVFNISNH